MNAESLEEWAARVALTQCAQDWEENEVNADGLELSGEKCPPDVVRRARALLAYRDRMVKGLSEGMRDCIPLIRENNLDQRRSGPTRQALYERKIVDSPYVACLTDFGREIDKEEFNDRGFNMTTWKGNGVKMVRSLGWPGNIEIVRSREPNSYVLAWTDEEVVGDPPWRKDGD